VIIAVASGQSVSSAFALSRAARGVAVFVGSHAANGWRVAFSPTSGGPTFYPVVALGGAGIPVWSGAAAGAFVVEFPPSPWARIEATSATMSTVSLQLLSIAR
jgi:hypothetical protein